MKKLILTGVVIMALFTLFGCGKKPVTDIIPDIRPESGGKVDHSFDAPKEIGSENIVAFCTHFYRNHVNIDYTSGQHYTFEVKKADDGTLILAETEALNIECTVPETIFKDIYDVIRGNNLFRLNGEDCYTAGLPPEYQPESLTAEFDSGEKLYFQTNGDPFASWTAELAEIFSKAFETAGDTTFRDLAVGIPMELGDARIWHIEFNETGMAKSPWIFIDEIQDEDEYACYMCDDQDGLHPYNDFIAPLEDGEKLINSLVDLGILTWDGFNRSRSSEPGLLDGDSRFFLVMYLDDGRSVRAEGYNSFPENYSEVKSLLYDFFDR